jgi:hypothetical protein
VAVSTLPCDTCGERVPGPLDNVYLKLLDGPDRYRLKLGLCREHLEQLLGSHEKEWLFVHPIYGEKLSDCCHRCGTVLGNGVAYDRFFADVYVRGYDKATYAATYCIPCASAIKSALDMELDRRVLHGPADSVWGRRTGTDRRQNRAEQSEGGIVNLDMSRRQNDPEAADSNRRQEPRPHD